MRLAQTKFRRLVEALVGPIFLTPNDVGSATEIIRRQFKGMQSVFFIQVGSNDGLTGDPLHPVILANPNWKGIFIEPVRYAFDRLRLNYKGQDRFIFENVAIGETCGEVDFFYMCERAKATAPDVREWYDQLGSFNRDQISKHFGGRLDQFIVTERMKCETLTLVLQRHAVDKIDLVHLDLEGFDYQVLRQFDFVKYHPILVMFEHKHLNFLSRICAMALLSKHSYVLHEIGGDTIAILKKQNNDG
jgi:FkbM family methyltransferase